MFALPACKKNSDFTTLTPNFYLLNGGVTDTSNTLLLFSSSDTVTYNIIISSTYYISSGALVSLDVNDDYRTSFNATYGTNYQAMPAGAYSFRDTISTNISESLSLYDTIPLTIFKHDLSPDQKYMLPIKILSAGKYNVDSSGSILYLRTVNSALSGIYNSFVTRTMYNGDAANNDISGVDTFTIVKALVPAATTSLLDYADLGVNGWKYNVGFSTDDNSFFAAPNSVITSSVQSGSFKTITATYNPANKDIYIKSSYKNTNGDERIVEESLTLY